MLGKGGGGWGGELRILLWCMYNAPALGGVRNGARVALELAPEEFYHIRPHRYTYTDINNLHSSPTRDNNLLNSYHIQLRNECSVNTKK